MANLSELAKQRSVQVLAVFAAATLGGYYLWLRKQKQSIKWAGADGTNKLLTEPKEVTACKKVCTGSSDYQSCMGNCLNKQMQQMQ